MGFGLGLGPVGILSEVLLPILANMEESKAIERANAENVKRYEEGLASIDSLRDQVLPLIQKSGKALVSELQKVYGVSKEQAAQITKAFEERYSRVMGRLEGLGTQERKDIQRAFSAERGTQQSNLTARGLGSTSMVNASRNALVREEQDALGRLSERLAREQNVTDLEASGDVLAAKGQEIDLGIAGGNAVANAQYGTAQDQAGALTSLTAMRNEWVYNREDEYLPTGTLTVLANSLQRARASKAQEDAAKAAGGGGIGGLTGAGGALAGFAVGGPVGAVVGGAAGSLAGGAYDYSTGAGGGYSGPSGMQLGNALYNTNQLTRYNTQMAHETPLYRR